jgi:hypothetical protein
MSLLVLSNLICSYRFYKQPFCEYKWYKIRFYKNVTRVDEFGLFL